MDYPKTISSYVVQQWRDLGHGVQYAAGHEAAGSKRPVLVFCTRAIDIVDRRAADEDLALHQAIASRNPAPRNWLKVYQRFEEGQQHYLICEPAIPLADVIANPSVRYRALPLRGWLTKVFAGWVPHRLLMGVLNGLKDLRPPGEAMRPHGRLSPETIFCRRYPLISCDDIALAVPLSGSTLSPSRHEDFRQLGQAAHALVTGQPAPHEGNKLADHPALKTLPRVWHDQLKDLIYVDFRKPEAHVQDFIKVVDPLGPRPGIYAGILSAAAAILLLAIALGIVLYQNHINAPARWDELGHISELAEEYSKDKKTGQASFQLTGDPNLVRIFENGLPQFHLGRLDLADPRPVSWLVKWDPAHNKDLDELQKRADIFLKSLKEWSPQNDLGAQVHALVTQLNGNAPNASLISKETAAALEKNFNGTTLRSPLSESKRLDRSVAYDARQAINRGNELSEAIALAAQLQRQVESTFSTGNDARDIGGPLVNSWLVTILDRALRSNLLQSNATSSRNALTQILRDTIQEELQLVTNVGLVIKSQEINWKYLDQVRSVSSSSEFVIDEDLGKSAAAPADLKSAIVLARGRKIELLKEFARISAVDPKELNQKLEAITKAIDKYKTENDLYQDANNDKAVVAYRSGAAELLKAENQYTPVARNAKTIQSKLEQLNGALQPILDSVNHLAQRRIDEYNASITADHWSDPKRVPPIMSRQFAESYKLIIAAADQYWQKKGSFPTKNVRVAIPQSLDTLAKELTQAVDSSDPIIKSAGKLLDLPDVTGANLQTALETYRNNALAGLKFDSYVSAVIGSLDDNQIPGDIFNALRAVPGDCDKRLSQIKAVHDQLVEYQGVLSAGHLPPDQQLSGRLAQIRQDAVAPEYFDPVLKRFAVYEQSLTKLLGASSIAEISESRDAMLKTDIPGKPVHAAALRALHTKFLPKNFAEEAKLREAIMPGREELLGLLADNDQQEYKKKEFNRWLQLLGQACASDSPEGLSKADTVVDQRSLFDLSSDADHIVQNNVELSKCRQMMKVAAKPQSDAELKECLKSAAQLLSVATSNGWTVHAAGGKLPDTPEALAKSIEDTIKKYEDNHPDRPSGDFGPPAPWKLLPPPISSAEGLWCVYEWNGHRIMFRRVSVSSTQRPEMVYVATEVLSVGLVSDWLNLKTDKTTKQAGNENLRDNVSLQDVFGRRQSHSPSTWEFILAERSASAGKDMRPGAWVSDHGNQNAFFNATGVVSSTPTDGHKPTRSSPLTQFDAGSSILVAASLRCRFPTPAEWAAANQDNDQPDDQLNFRDSSWLEQFNLNLSNKGKSEFDCFPDNASVFHDPTDWIDSRVHSSRGEAPEAKGKDGWVMPCPVDQFPNNGQATSKYVHLRGNVAQFAVQSAGIPAEDSGYIEKMNEWIKANWAKVGDIDALKFFTDNGLSLVACGGSFNSLPGEQMIYPIPELNGVKDRTVFNQPFPDVGVRLVFPAAPPSLLAMVQQSIPALKEGFYLVPKAAGDESPSLGK